MKRCTKCGETKIIAEFYKTKATKIGISPACKKCLIAAVKVRSDANPEVARARANKWRNDNPERESFNKKVYRSANKDRIAEASKAWSAANPGRVAARAKAWRELNKERAAAVVAAWHEANPQSKSNSRKRWAKANPSKVNVFSAGYRAAKLNATPIWADEVKVAEFYTTAKALDMLLGEWHEVDHIVPLRHKLVCGLHNEFNLQILTSDESKRKWNFFEVA